MFKMNNKFQISEKTITCVKYIIARTSFNQINLIVMLTSLPLNIYGRKKNHNNSKKMRTYNAG